MTTIDIDNDCTQDTTRPARTGLVRRWLAALRWRHMRRATLVELGRLDERLLRDIGIEPGDVYDALGGRRSSVLLNPLRKPERR